MKLIVQLVFVLVLIVTTGCSNAEESDKKPWAPYTDDMTPKDYYLEDEVSGKTWHFRIPKAYLPSEMVQGKLGKRRAEIHAGLPDLEPRKVVFEIGYEQGTNEYAKAVEKLKNGLFITIGGNEQTAFRINNVVNRMKKKGALIPSKYERLLEVVEKDQCEKINQLGHHASYKCEDRGVKIFITSDKNPATWRSYSCKTSKPRFGCRVNSTFRGMRVTYIFRNTELDRLDKFERAVQTILERFYVDNEKVVH